MTEQIIEHTFIAQTEMLHTPHSHRKMLVQNIVLHTPKRSYKGVTLKQYFTMSQQGTYCTPTSQKNQMDVLSLSKHRKPDSYHRNELRKRNVRSLDKGKDDRYKQKSKQQLEQPTPHVFAIRKIPIYGLKELKICSQRLQNRTDIIIEKAPALSSRNLFLSLPNAPRRQVTENPSSISPRNRERHYYAGQQRKEILEKLRRKEQTLRTIRSTMSLFVNKFNPVIRKRSKGVREG